MSMYNRMEPDLRRQRAMSLTAAVMQELDQFFDHDDRREISDRLMMLFTRKGIEVLSDFDREKLGLSPRNNEGWTTSELQTLDALRMMKMLEPMKITVPSYADIMAQSKETPPTS